MAKNILNELECQIDPLRKVSDLSVAEQQMVEIAKSLSYNCRLLIMDEPTAALTDNEISVLFKIIKKLRDKGVAIIYISHRMSSCKFCDRIVVLDHGEIVEEGTHDSLMERNGIYAKLYQKQAEYYVTAQAGA